MLSHSTRSLKAPGLACNYLLHPLQHPLRRPAPPQTPAPHTLPSPLAPSTPSTPRTATRPRAAAAAGSTGDQQQPRVTNEQLLEVARRAASLGAAVVMEAAGKPRSVSRKEGTDIVTETDQAAERVITAAILEAFPDHAVLGEEGGLSGSPSSQYLWCIDPLDGTVNFTHGIPSFNVSVGVLRHATPMAGCVIEFLRAPGGWTTRTFWAQRNGGAFLDGKVLRVSDTRDMRDAVVATELVWYPDMWAHLQPLHQDFTEQSRGIRMCGAAAANLCHLAEGSVDVYWQYRLKPWDAAAGVLIAEEAGARVSTGSGTAYSPFDKSLLAANDVLYDKALALLSPAEERMLDDGVDLAPFKIQGYRVRAGPQLQQ